MNDKEFKHYENQEASQQKKSIRDISYEEKESFLKREGWTCKTNNSVGFNIEFFYHPDFSVGIGTVESAYERAVRYKEKQDRKEKIREGKMECLCNECGEDLAKRDEDSFLGYYGLADAEVTGGYHSYHLSDTLTYRFSLCEKCLHELFKSFKNPPEISTYM